MTTIPAMLLAFLGCGATPSSDHGHDHGDHGHGDGHSEEDDGASIAITRWTKTHELFVELDAPVAGHRFAYHAHVTRLADNHAATSGILSIRFEKDGFAVESHTDEEIARAGIFAEDATAPSQPGEYRLLISFVDGDERADWDGGPVTVGASKSVPHLGEDEGEVSFLKETQWQVPFAVAPAIEVKLAPTIEATAAVAPAPGQSTVVAAPVEGLLAWSDDLPVVGRRVQRGERLAALVPAGAAESWSRLQAGVATAAVDLNLARTELARVEGLRSRDLLPERRLQEAEAGVERALAELSANQRRVSALTSARSGAMPIQAPADGMVVAVGGAHGQRVAAGAPLVTVASGPGLMLKGHVHDREHTDLATISSVAIQRGDWDAPRSLVGARVLTDRLVFDAHTLSAPITVLVDDPAGLSVGDLVQLEVGVGEPEPRLAIPRTAVVEINGQDVVFVQKTGESFTRRRVTLGVADPTHVEVLSGIEPGEMVVVEGGFDVHVASLSGALESHRH